MKEHRKHTRRTYARRILRAVADHPANADHRIRAVARAVAWQARKLITDAPRDVTFRGMTIRCYPDSASASNVVYFTPQYDWDAMAFLEAYLRPGEGFIDVGANIGTYTLLAAACTGSTTGRGLVAVEPLPSAIARLRENLAVNGLDEVEVHEAAATDRDGEVGFLDFDVSSTVEGEVDPRGRTAFPVRAARLDALVRTSGIGAAKIDVEGLEARTLAGATRLVERQDPPVWLVELMDWQLAKHGSSVDAVVTWMAERSYAPWWYDEASGTLDRERATWERHENAIFIADEHLERVRRRLAEGRPQTAVGESRQR